MQYKITTPTPGYTGEVAGVAFAKGIATIDDSDERQRRALAYFRRKAYVVEAVDVDEAPAAPAVEPTTETPAPPAERPNRGDSKVTWITYVTSDAAGDKRLDPAEAEAKTRDQLAEHVLGPKEA